MEVEPIARVRRSVWGMLYADDADIVSMSAESLTKMTTTVIVTVFEAAGLTVSETKTETTMLVRTLNQVGAPDLTARRRRSGPRAYADGAVFVPRRSCRSKRRHQARF